MANSTADSQTAQQTTVETQCTSTSHEKTKIFGLYGLSGSGKSFLLSQLKEKLGGEDYIFYDGSEAIDEVVEGGLEAFKALTEEEKVHWREVAIQRIENACTDSGKIGIVAGHYMFWHDEMEPAGEVVCTQKDLDIFTHILYLDVPAGVIAERRKSDESRDRSELPVAHFTKWQKEEVDKLRADCRQNKILFSTVSPLDAKGCDLLDTVLRLLQDFQNQTEEKNLDKAKDVMNAAIRLGGGRWKTMLVLDADGTLAPQDGGRMFWDEVGSTLPSTKKEWPVKCVFKSPKQYCFTKSTRMTKNLRNSAKKWPPKSLYVPKCCSYCA
jgi:adenylylsulfate kinase-like enzyme